MEEYEWYEERVHLQPSNILHQCRYDYRRHQYQYMDEEDNVHI